MRKAREHVLELLGIVLYESTPLGQEVWRLLAAGARITLGAPRVSR